MNDLSIAVCDCNTPYLIENLLKSINKFCGNTYKIIIANTGNTHIDYTKFSKDISYIENFGGSHGDTVNLLMNIVKSKYMLLVDSDVLFLKDLEIPFKKIKELNATIMGEVVGNRGGKDLYPRVNPWFCFMDLEILKQNNIKFYDHYRTKLIKSKKTYDIGSTIFEDVLNVGLTIADVKMEGKYFKHYEGMSWRVQKYDPNKNDTDIDVGGTHNNKNLYEYGLLVLEQYKKDVFDL